MEIHIDINDIYACKKCGVVFGLSETLVVEEQDNMPDKVYYVCPLCKSKKIIEEW